MIKIAPLIEIAPFHGTPHKKVSSQRVLGIMIDEDLTLNT